jgi:hypothetical protein
MQQFGSPEQEAMFTAIMALKDRERASWAKVITLKGQAYAAAETKHLVTLKFPREEAWDAYATKFLGGSSLTKIGSRRHVWRTKNKDSLADIVSAALKG